MRKLLTAVCWKQSTSYISVCNRRYSVLLKDTTECLQRGSNQQPLDLESGILPQSHCAPHKYTRIQKKPISHFLGQNMFYTIFFNNQLCIKILNNVTVLLKPVYAVRQCVDNGSFLKMTSFRQCVSLEFSSKSVHYVQ